MRNAREVRERGVEDTESPGGCNAYETASEDSILSINILPEKEINQKLEKCRDTQKCIILLLFACKGFFFFFFKLQANLLEFCQ